MLVVMHTSARSEQIESVCDLGRTAGLDPTVFDGDPAMVLLAGTPLADIEAATRELPGVERIAEPVACASPVTSNLRIAGIRPLTAPAISDGTAPACIRIGGAGPAIAARHQQHSRWPRRPPGRRRRSLFDSRCRGRARLCRPSGCHRARAFETICCSCCASISKSRAPPSAGRDSSTTRAATAAMPSTRVCASLADCCSTCSVLVCPPVANSSIRSRPSSSPMR